MELIGQYILSITAATIISSLSIRLLGNSKSSKAIVKLISGVFMTVTVLSPLTKIQFRDLSESFIQMDSEAASIVNEGKTLSAESMRTGIKNGLESYILDKASALGLDLNVSVLVSDDALPAPVSVKIEGIASPYAKKRLMQVIATELGVPEENQVWN